MGFREGHAPWRGLEAAKAPSLTVAMISAETPKL